MTPTEKGRFCAACQKQVIDFTRASDREIAKALEKTDNVCARISPTQKDRDLAIPHHKKNQTAAVIAIAALSLSPTIIYAQQPTQTQQQQETTEHEIMGKIMITPPNMIQGIVIDEFNEPLAGASIIVKGTNISTVTDLDGKFSIQANKGTVLEISFVGYETIETTVTGKDFDNPLKLNGHPVFMGELVVVKQRTFFGRIFHKIGTIFSKDE
ncbi:carboxypeptidase-like regulatory domain-containing protein [Flavobacterium sp. RHBU_3]|uniref:carboxypeptidase-like regulatory domain-containing protein n=1 Tax=Flavobacterium sp. RHBU_3 TaxID=3391184 RepID=UPI003984798F